MNIRLISARQWTGRFRVAFVFQGLPGIPGIARAESASLLKVAAEENFKGRYKQVAVLRESKGGRRLILSGLGRKNELTSDRLRVATAKAVRAAEEMGAEELGLLLPKGTTVTGGKRNAEAGSPLPTAGTSMIELARAVVEGGMLGSYRYVEHRQVRDDETRPVAQLSLLAATTPSPELKAAVKEAAATADAVCYVRDLVNEPPSQKVPEMMAELANWLARPDRLSVEVLRKDELVRAGMNGILRVGAGSEEAPCFVHLTYRPSGPAKKRVVVVGKGVTFDSGGLTLKPPTAMDGMKQDMAGAATVFGLFKLLGDIELPLEIHGLVPLAENMPSGTAQKPGDVIRHYGGKTVEVLNTDAEGRLILADALVYGSELKPDLMIDIATLTGAAVIALGDECTALLGTDRSAIDEIVRLGREQGEMFWELPLPERYRSHLKSKVADIKNTGKPMNAGAIVAGMFLKEFVGNGIPWVHMDIAGPAFTKDAWDYTPVGGTGVPLRTLFAFLRGL